MLVPHSVFGHLAPYQLAVLYMKNSLLNTVEKNAGNKKGWIVNKAHLIIQFDQLKHLKIASPPNPDRGIQNNHAENQLIRLLQ